MGFNLTSKTGAKLEPDMEIWREGGNRSRSQAAVCFTSEPSPGWLSLLLPDRRTSGKQGEAANVGLKGRAGRGHAAHQALSSHFRTSLRTAVILSKSPIIEAQVGDAQ